MAQRLKSWESPRKQGRNDKGRGGSARARQLKKQQQMLRKKLKEQNQGSAEDQKKSGGRESHLFPYFFMWQQIALSCRAFARWRQVKRDKEDKGKISYKSFQLVITLINIDIEKLEKMY